MEAHKVNVSKNVQTPQLSSYNQMSITSGCQQKDGGQPHFLWESMKHSERLTAENNMKGHLLGMNSMLISSGDLGRHSQSRD